MSTAGEAASLFGAADATGDPFAEALDSTVDSRGGEPLAASDIFQGVSSGPEAFGQGEPAAAYVSNGHEGYNSWYDGGNQSGFVPPTAGNTTSDHTQSYQANGWYDQYSLPQAQGNQQSSSAYDTYQTSTAGHTTHTYDAYAPSPSPYVPPAPPSQPYASQNSIQPAYDAYRPAQQPSTSSYFPSNNPTTQAYDSSATRSPSYMPAALQSHASYSYPSDPPIQTPSTFPPPPTVPSAPTVSAASYRPKTSNAYDPPLPPPKPLRIGSASLHPHPRPISTPLTPSYDQVQAPAMPPPRKPPPKGSSTAVSPGPQQSMHVYPQHASGNYSNVNAPSQGMGEWNPAEVSVAPNGHFAQGHAQNHRQFQSTGHHQNTLPDNVLHTSVSPSPPPISHRAQVNPSFGTHVQGHHVEAVGEFSASSHMYHDVEDAVDVEFSQAPRTLSPQQVTVPTENVPSSTAHIQSTQVSSTSQPAQIPTSYDPYQPSRSQLCESPRVASPERIRSPPRPFEVPHASNGLSERESTYSTERSKSPGSASIRSSSSAVGSTAPNRRQNSVASSVSPPPVNHVYHPRVASPYEPSAWTNERSASPAASISSVKGLSGVASDAYAPTRPPYAHARTLSNGSNFSSTSMQRDPYAPSTPSRRPSYAENPSTVIRSQAPDSDTRSLHSYGDHSPGQVLHAPPLLHTAYAPSPSLLGTNDPLGRTAARAPIISFGAGGRLVTCFHGAGSLNTGFDVALSSRQSTDVKLYTLHKVIPESACTTSAVAYPGPLFADPGTPTTSLVRTGLAAQVKTKKARVIKYLEERAEELSAGIGYLHEDSPDRRRTEAKRTLLVLLKVMVENDGHLSGSSEIDKAVRASLLPNINGSLSPHDLMRTASSLSISRNADNLASDTAVAFAMHGVQDPHDKIVASHTVRSSNLDRIQDFLLRGDRRAACHYAADEKLWAHAMIIASSVDKDAWKDVVTEFVRTELTGLDNGTSTESNGREALRVAYSLFSGQGPSAVMELLPPKSLVQHANLNAQSLQIPPSLSSLTPMTPSFPLIQPVNMPPEVLTQWANTAAMIISNPLTAESSAALTALGDQLAANHWIEAAHVCYLLSPQTSPVGGVGSSSRIVLVGSSSPHLSPSFFKDPDPIIFSEIVEFALSLATPVKGKEPFVGFPHLQPYRLLRAATLAEMGHVQLANRYCDAISSSLGRSSPYFTVTFMEQLKGLSDRLTAAPQLEKSTSWMGSKMPKPSLDTIGTYIGSSLTKFIAGEGDSPRQPESGAPPPQDRTYSGPFAHYSTISSATSSNAATPNGSMTDLNERIGTPPLRSGSSMALRPPTSHVAVNRASSAMDFVNPVNRKASPIQRVLSASAATTSFPDASSSSYYRSLDNSGSRYDVNENNSDAGASQNGDSPGEQPSFPQVASWWGSSDSTDATTPTASAFVKLDTAEIPATSSSGFISLMDDPSFSATPTATSHSSFSRGGSEQTSFDEEDDDLGLGNKSARQNTQEDELDKPETEETKPSQPAEKPPLQSASSGSWISRLWGKRDTTSPGPVKANLGEQTTFYYDKELKRWVNKSAGAETTKAAAPPPPPSRAQTASPSKSIMMSSGSPPVRPATANGIDLNEPSRKLPPRARSNLVPDESNGHSAFTPPPRSPLAGRPITPASSGMPPAGSPNSMDAPPLPTGRTKPQTKRPVRNRYVDVFQQPAGGN